MTNPPPPSSRPPTPAGGQAPKKPGAQTPAKGTQPTQQAPQPAAPASPAAPAPQPAAPTSLTGLSAVKLALMAKQARLQVGAITRAEPIAIVGMGCRFPGGVDSPERYWELLRDGVDAVGPAPRDRWNDWNGDALYDPDPAAPGKLSVREGGFIDRVDLFDAGFFGINRREAEQMDPQHRLFLEVAIESLDRAGLSREQLAGSLTGVFVASYFNDYQQLAYSDPEAIDERTLTGTQHSVLANRLSYLLDLRGPSVSVDTACSSSLVAVHLACQSLRAGDSDIAVAAGVSLMLAAETMIALSKVGFMSPTDAQRVQCAVHQARRAERPDQRGQPVQRGAVVARRERDQPVHEGGAAEELQVVPRHHAALRVTHQVDLGRAGRREHPGHERGQLARRGGDVPGALDDRRRRAPAVVEGEDAVPVVGQQRRGGLPVVVLVRERAVHQDDRIRVRGRRLAAEVVRPGGGVCGNRTRPARRWRSRS